MEHFLCQSFFLNSVLGSVACKYVSKLEKQLNLSCRQMLIVYALLFIYNSIFNVVDGYLRFDLIYRCN